MTTINPYLNFPGNTEEAFNFYKSVFGGEFQGEIARFKNTPGCENVPEADQNKVMHVALPIGNSVLMGTDAIESMGQTITTGNNFHITINPDSEQEADKLFNAIADGGNITMPLQKMFWGAYFGMATDKFGVSWMVNYQVQQ